MRDRLEGLGRRLVAYTVMIVAAIIILRILLHTVIGFVHMLIVVAIFVFAIYAFFWGRSLKNRAS
jgi:hypothetical protein